MNQRSRNFFTTGEFFAAYFLIVLFFLSLFSHSSSAGIRGWFHEDQYYDQFRLKGSVGIPILGDYKTGSYEFPIYAGAEYHLNRPYEFSKFRFWLGAEVSSYVVLPFPISDFGYRHLTRKAYLTRPSLGVSGAVGRVFGRFIPYFELNNQLHWYYGDKYDLYLGRPVEEKYHYVILPSIGVRTKTTVSFHLKIDYPFLFRALDVDEAKYEKSVIEEEKGKLITEVPVYATFGVNILLKQFGAQSLYQRLLTQNQKELEKDLELERQRNAIFVFEEVTFDEDQDGVRDEFDECPSTPRGAQVDYKGCLSDIDLDGVADYYDFCPNTPRGREVGNQGCPDIDLDGIPDFKDQCNNTPLGTAIDKYGCSISSEDTTIKRYMPQYIPLKSYVLNFKRNSDEFDIESSEVFIDLMLELRRSKTSKWIVEGHTSKKGSFSSKMRLSKALINSVLQRIFEKGISKSKFQDLINVLDIEPVTEDQTLNGDLKNIRVEVIKVKN